MRADNTVLVKYPNYTPTIAVPGAEEKTYTLVALSVGRIRSNASRKVPLYCQLLRNYDLWINKRTIRTVRENQQHQTTKGIKHGSQTTTQTRAQNLEQTWRSGADVLSRRGSRFPLQITWLPRADSRAPLREGTEAALLPLRSSSHQKRPHQRRLK